MKTAAISQTRRYYFSVNFVKKSKKHHINWWFFPGFPIYRGEYFSDCRYPLCFKVPSSCRLKSAKVSSPAFLRAITTMSKIARKLSRCKRNICLIRRLILFRITARRSILVVTVMPRRLTGVWPGAIRMRKCLLYNFSLVFCTPAKSELFLSLLVGGKLKLCGTRLLASLRKKNTQSN